MDNRITPDKTGRFVLHINISKQGQILRIELDKMFLDAYLVGLCSTSKLEVNFIRLYNLSNMRNKAEYYSIC
jgi:hypothetical protein